MEKYNIPEYYKFDYELDTFQIEGCKSIYNNENILVTAHTGSGKTALALYGISKTLHDNKKVIYTSPIKTLSNQKYAEFSKHYDSIGIMTGDIKINPLGDVLIMTAEILKNSLLRKHTESVYEWNFNPLEIGCVILDEVHFINNEDRGHVWEEIIMNLPNHVQLIMLSATIVGADKMANWIQNIKNIPCNLITTLKRPVPLQHGIWWNNEINYFLYGDTNWRNGIWSEISNNINTYYKKHKWSIDIFFKCIKYLFDNNMTPANIFLLNRNMIEEYVNKIPYTFINNKDEIHEIKKIWNTYLLKYKDLYETSNEWNNLYKLIQKGIGYHHSGMIPILKEIVEILYEKGLIKILLSTETFAMGVNMPTKSVVFCNLLKYNGRNTHYLKPEEYGQMAGRAGRRGIDNIGNVIILPTIDFITEQEAQNMILSKPTSISSKLSLDSVYILKQISYLIDNNNFLNFNEMINKIKMLFENTFFNYDDNYIIQIKEEYNNKVKELNMFDIPLNKIEIYNKIKLINGKLKQNLIKLSSKQEKKLLKERNDIINTISKNDLIEIEKYINLKNKVLELENNIIFEENKIKIQIEYILNHLIDINFIEIKDDIILLTLLGKIVSQVNECNPFLLAELLYDETIDELNFDELIGLFSLLLNENKINHNIIELDNTIMCDNIIKNLEKKIDIYYELEIKLNNNIPYPFWNNMNLNYDIFNIVKYWADGKDWKYISNIFNSFEGDFIKIILRLTNLLKNIESIVKILNRTNLLNKLNEYTDKLIRDIITTDSLYL
jgi:superfamily II RNA helicase